MGDTLPITTGYIIHTWYKKEAYGIFYKSRRHFSLSNIFYWVNATAVVRSTLFNFSFAEQNIHNC